MKNMRTLSILALVFVAFGYTLLNIVVRLMGEGLQPMTQVYLRIGLGLIVAFLVFRKDIRFNEIAETSMKDKIVLLMMGTIAYSVAVYFVTMGALNTSLFNVSVVYSTIGFFVYIYSMLFLKSKFNPLVVLLISLSFIGIVFISGKSFVPNFSNFGIGEVYVLLAAAFMGFFSIGRKLLSGKLNNKEITVVVMLIGCVSGFALALMKGEPLPSMSAFSVSVLIGLGLGAVLNITSNLFESFAFEHIDVVLGNQLLLLESLFSLIIGFLFYREMISFPEFVGSGLILASVYWSNKVL